MKGKWHVKGMKGKWHASEKGIPCFDFSARSCYDEKKIQKGFANNERYRILEKNKRLCRTGHG